MSNSSANFLLLFLIFLASSIASNARPIDVSHKENDVKSSVPGVHFPEEPAPPNLSEAAENGSSLKEKKVQEDNLKTTIYFPEEPAPPNLSEATENGSSLTKKKVQEDNLKTTIYFPEEAALPNLSEAAENGSSLTEQKVQEDNLKTTIYFPEEPAPPNLSEAVENGSSLKENKAQEDKKITRDEKPVTKSHIKSQGPHHEESAADQIEPLANVSWKLPQKKHGEKRPGFNLDYAPPKTHPPVHN